MGDEIDPIIVVLFQSQIVQGETHIRCTILQPSTVCWIEVESVAPIGSPWLIQNMYSRPLVLNRSTHHCLKHIPLNPIPEKSYPLDLIVNILAPSHHWIPWVPQKNLPQVASHQCAPTPCTSIQVWDVWEGISGRNVVANHIWLVVWNIFYFSIKLGIIIPTD